MKILFINNQRKYRNPEGKCEYSKKKGYSKFWNSELFREELFRQADIIHCGWGYDSEWRKNRSLLEVIKKIKRLDVILSHCDLENCHDYSKITNILKVLFAGDYLSDDPRLPKFLEIFQKHDYDLVFGYSNSVIKQLRKDQIGKKQILLPFGVDLHRFKNLQLEKKYDVAAFYSIKPTPYLFRRKILKMIRSMEISIWIKQVWLDLAVIKINEARVFINSTAEFDFVNPRVTEVLACGTFLLTDRNEELTNFGYKDKYHLVIFNDLSELKEKIHYYLEHEEEREQIAQQGMEFVRTNYSNEKRVKKLLEIIQDELTQNELAQNELTQMD